MRNLFFFVLFLFLIVPREMDASAFRHYREEIVESSQKTLIHWIPPSHWIQYPNQKMRLVNFKIPSQSGESICSITLLPLFSADHLSNVQRWGQQINLNLSSDQIASFVKKTSQKKNKNNLSYYLFDLTQFSPNENAPSILVAIFHLPNNIAFVKLTGSLKTMTLCRKDFLIFLETLSLMQT